MIEDRLAFRLVHCRFTIKLSLQMTFLRLLAGLLALSGFPACAAEWFVSTVGNNATGNGSAGAPYRTLAHVLAPANAIVSAGDTVSLIAPVGNTTFNECEVRLRVRLTLRSAPGNNARIHCDFTLPANVGTVTIQIDPNASGSRVANLEISGGYYYGIFLQTNWDQGENPNGTGASNVMIEDVAVHSTGRDAIKITPKSINATIRRAEIYNTGVRDNSNAEGIDNVNGSGMIVEDSYIYNTATTGVYFKGGAANVIVQRNRIENTGGAGILIGFDTSPAFFDLTLNPQYYEAIGGIVRNNIVRNTQLAGIGLYASNNAVVANNTIVNAAQGAHAAIYFGVTFQDYDANAGRPANNNPFIRNNLIIQNARACMSIRYSSELGGLSGLNGSTNSNYNAFHNTAGACSFSDGRSLPATFNGNLAGWRTRTSNEANSIETALPLTADGHLSSGSPAINAGQTIAQVTDDFDRQTRIGAVDIGADEVVTLVACNLDLDGNGAVNAMSDALLLRRYLANTQSNIDLTQHARGAGGIRAFSEIQTSVEAMRNSLAIDVDGDGFANEKDSLLVLRALLGFTGSSVTNGLSFAGSARSEWVAIRGWLNTQCALTLP
jgi:Right handed beta helix region/Dockerin type I domain